MVISAIIPRMWIDSGVIDTTFHLDIAIASIQGVLLSGENERGKEWKNNWYPTNCHELNLFLDEILVDTGTGMITGPCSPFGSRCMTKYFFQVNARISFKLAQSLIVVPFSSIFDRCAIVCRRKQSKIQAKYQAMSDCWTLCSREEINASRHKIN
jgi:hypothetical protein